MSSSLHPPGKRRRQRQRGDSRNQRCCNTNRRLLRGVSCFSVYSLSSLSSASLLSSFGLGSWFTMRCPLNLGSSDDSESVLSLSSVEVSLSDSVSSLMRSHPPSHGRPWSREQPNTQSRLSLLRARGFLLSAALCPLNSVTGVPSSSSSAASFSSFSPSSSAIQSPNN